jgi:ABC-type Fe3+/spermidine/putrescine transport system ATPase subunit
MNAFAKRRVTDLSGGEQQRVALARALVPHPRLLMLDEPLGALDRALREQLSEDLRAVLQQMDIPVIYVTHDQEEAFTFGDRLFILHEGRIIQSGSPDQVYNHPDSLWLAAFFGHKNRLDGHVVESEPLRVRTADGLLECGPQSQEYQKGQIVTVVLPLDAASLAADEKNTLDAWVKDIRFQGMGYMIDFQLAHGQEMTFFFNESLPRGGQVRLALQPHSILCFPKIEGQGT